MKKRNWTAREDELLRHWPKLTDAQIAERLPFRTADAVTSRRKRLSLQRKRYGISARMEALEAACAELLERVRNLELNCPRSSFYPQKDRSAPHVILSEDRAA